LVNQRFSSAALKILKKSCLLFLLLFLSNSLFTINNCIAGAVTAITGSDTDNDLLPFNGLFYFFDLRDRETFIQLTYNDGFGTGLNGGAHIQIFDVSNNCNENDFFDNYTINDTHVYNMRDIQTNDGNPSGVVLPNGAYGMVVITVITNIGLNTGFGNFRIIDESGYEYRTNAQSITTGIADNDDFNYQINFNKLGGVTFSDVVGITVNRFQDPDFFRIFKAADVTEAFNPLDIDIVNNNEVIFSCRNVIFACIDEDNPRLEELLVLSGEASVASFEYGINNAIPHSRDGELLCPGNTIQEGAVILNPLPQPIGPEPFPFFLGYIGLNNGNGRGSMDSFWSNVPFGGFG